MCPFCIEFEFEFYWVVGFLLRPVLLILQEFFIGSCCWLRLYFVKWGPSKDMEDFETIFHIIAHLEVFLFFNELYFIDSDSAPIAMWKLGQQQFSVPS